MSDAMAALDAYARSTPFDHEAASITREQISPAAFRALRAVLDLHKPFRIYDECGHNHAEGEAGVIEVEEIGLVCEDGYQYSICGECCADDVYQKEECGSDHHHPCYPCPTVRAITSVLGDTTP